MTRENTGGPHALWGKVNPYRMLLEMLNPQEEQPDLQRLHEPVEAAIAAAKKRCEDYGGTDVDEDVRDTVDDEESGYVEELVGVAFVICQSRLTKVATRIIELHNYHARHGRQFKCVEIPQEKGINERKKAVFKACSKMLDGTAFTEIQVVNAFANYFKHHEEWVGSWDSLDRSARSTAEIVRAAGGDDGYTGNLRRGAKTLGVTDYERLTKIRHIIEVWHTDLYEAHERELCAVGLLR